MGNVLVNESSLSAIANAIRSKNGSSNTYKPREMAEAIGNISSVNLGSKSITENGTYSASDDGLDGYSSVSVGVSGGSASGTKHIAIAANGTTIEDVTAYANAEITVAVDGYTLEDIIARRAPAGSVTWTRNTYPFEFYQNKVVTAVTYTGATEIGASAFEGCTALASVDMPDVTKINSKAFYGCTALTAVSFKKAVLNSSNYSNVWGECKNLVSAVIASATLLAQYLFDGCSALEVVDAKGGNSIAAYAFRNCTNLKKLILRSATAGALANISAFTGTPFASNGSGGTLYVPSSVLSNYQSAANWSTILGYANNTILPIEGSIYETQYADGTLIES